MKAPLFFAAAMAVASHIHAQTGNVGIGTINPTDQLHTTGSVRHQALSGSTVRPLFVDSAGRLVTSTPAIGLAANTSLYAAEIQDNSCGSPAKRTSSYILGATTTVVPSSQIKVRIQVEHSYVSDLAIWLVSPMNDTLLLTADLGGSGRNLTNTIFTDAAAGTLPYSGVGAPFGGAYKPVGTLGTKCGITSNCPSFAAIGGGTINPYGNWRLILVDDATGDVGTLLGWRITFDGSDPAILQNALDEGRLVKWQGGMLANSMLAEGDGARLGIGTLLPSSSVGIDARLRYTALGIRDARNSAHHMILRHYGDHAALLAGGADYLSLGVHDNDSAGSYFNGYYQEGLRIMPNGFVGVGGTTPNAPLQFPNSLSNRKIALYETGTNEHQFYGFGVNNATLRYQTDATGADHVFYAATSATASNELMRIRGDGNVGIGVNPGYRLHVESAGFTTAFFSSTSPDPTGVIRISVPATNSACAQCSEYIVFQKAAFNIGSITADLSTNTVAYNTTSDKRLKENIVPTRYGLQDLMRIQIKDYNFIGTTARTTGVLAQDLHAIYPAAVKEGDRGEKVENAWAVDYGKLTPLLIKAVQDQQVEIEALKAENAELRRGQEGFAEMARRLGEVEGRVDGSTVSAKR